MRRLLLWTLCVLLAGCGTPHTLPLSIEDQAATNIVNVNATQNVQSTQTAQASGPAPQAAETRRPDPERTLLEQELGWSCPLDLDGDTLYVANWSTYIADNTIANFEQLCEVQVDYYEFDGMEELWQILRTGSRPLDVIVPSDVDVGVMIQEHRLTPLNRTRLTGFANLNPEMLNRNFDPQNVYSVPYLWGTLGVAYNTTTVMSGIARWSDVFDARNYRVGWMNTGRELLGIALLVQGHDPNTDNPAQVADARDYLLGWVGDNVRMIEDDEGQDLLAAGELDIVIEYNGDIFQLLTDCACSTYTYRIPGEGTIAWIDSLAIPATSQHPRLAHAFIDYLLQPRVAADIANTTAYASPNLVAFNRGLIDEALSGNPAIYPADESYALLYSLVSTPELDALYVEMWQEVAAALGG